MGFWSGLGLRLGGSLGGMLILGSVIVLVSQFVSDPDEIMVYSFILVPIVSISIAASIYYILE